MELLVVIAVVGILIALLLPAVQAARESARRANCQSNLKQIGLAVHNHVDVRRAFPPGQFNYVGTNTMSAFNPLGLERRGWFEAILPFVEEQALADFSRQASLTDVGFDISVAYEWTRIPLFMCPTDPNAGKNTTSSSGAAAGSGGYSAQQSQGMHGNYVLCAGSTVFGNSASVAPATNGSQLNGMALFVTTVRLRSVTDGLSRTLLGSEIILVPDTPASNDLRGRYFNNWEGNCLFSTLYSPNTLLGDVSGFCIAAPQAPCRLSTTGVVQSARSLHPGGANFLWADGSVAFLSDDIAPSTYQALGTRAGGEVPGIY